MIKHGTTNQRIGKRRGFGFSCLVAVVSFTAWGRSGWEPEHHELFAKPSKPKSIFCRDIWRSHRIHVSSRAKAEVWRWSKSKQDEILVHWGSIKLKWDLNHSAWTAKVGKRDLVIYEPSPRHQQKGLFDYRDGGTPAYELDCVI